MDNICTLVITQEDIADSNFTLAVEIATYIVTTNKWPEGRIDSISEEIQVELGDVEAKYKDKYLLIKE